MSDAAATDGPPLWDTRGWRVSDRFPRTSALPRALRRPERGLSREGATRGWGAARQPTCAPGPTLRPAPYPGAGGHGGARAIADRRRRRAARAAARPRRDRGAQGQSALRAGLGRGARRRRRLAALRLSLPEAAAAR